MGLKEGASSVKSYQSTITNNMPSQQKPRDLFIQPSVIFLRTTNSELPTKKMQNKPNLKTSKITVSDLLTTDYSSLTTDNCSRNKPNQSQFMSADIPNPKQQIAKIEPTTAGEALVDFAYGLVRPFSYVPLRHNFMWHLWIECGILAPR